MNYCYSCGTKVEQNYKFCPSCGIKLEGGSFKENKPEYIERQEEVENNKQIKYSLKHSILSFIFGFCSLYFSICSLIPAAGLYVFLPTFIVFTCLAKKFGRKHLNTYHSRNGFVKAGVILSTIAIPVGVVCTIIGCALFGLSLSEGA